MCRQVNLVIKPIVHNRIYRHLMWTNKSLEINGILESIKVADLESALTKSLLKWKILSENKNLSFQQQQLIGRKKCGLCEYFARRGEFLCCHTCNKFTRQPTLNRSCFCAFYAWLYTDQDDCCKYLDDKITKREAAKDVYDILYHRWIELMVTEK